MQDSLPEEQATWRCVGFRWRDYPNNSHQLLYVNLLKTACGCLPIIRTKFRHLNSCVTGRLFLGWLCRNDPEYSSAIARTFDTNSVIEVENNHILNAIYWNNNESSAGTSGCNGEIFLKIDNFH